MCAVSVILDYGRNQIPPQDWNHQSWRDYKELVRKAEAFDREHDQPDCDDPAKAEWMEQIEDRLKRLEARAER